MLAKAIAIAAEGFKNKKDKAGKPYILHCLTVMNDLHSDDEEEKDYYCEGEVSEEKYNSPENLLRDIYEDGYFSNQTTLTKIREVVSGVN